MEIVSRRESAKIYRFPVGGRAGLERRKAPRTAVPAPVFGSGWYHEQAIKDDKPGDAPPRC